MRCLYIYTVYKYATFLVQFYSLTMLRGSGMVARVSLYHLSKPSKLVMELNLPNKAWVVTCCQTSVESLPGSDRVTWVDGDFVKVAAR